MSGLPLPSSLGVFKRVVGADPGANTEFLLTVPTGKYWWVVSVIVSLVQGITQTPQPILIVDDGVSSVFESLGSSAVQAVSTTCTYTWAGDVQITGQVGSGANVHSLAPLPQNFVLPPGYRIRSNTLGIGANSDYGVPAALVCEIG